MPEFRFRYTGKQSVPTRHGLPAENEMDAFVRKDAFLSKYGGKYVVGSMEAYRGSTWHKVPDPSQDPLEKTLGPRGNPAFSDRGRDWMYSAPEYDPDRPPTTRR